MARYPHSHFSSSNERSYQSASGATTCRNLREPGNTQPSWQFEALAMRHALARMAMGNAAPMRATLI